jgi:hypothetical protein
MFALRDLHAASLGPRRAVPHRAGVALLRVQRRELPVVRTPEGHHESMIEDLKNVPATAPEFLKAKCVASKK